MILKYQFMIVRQIKLARVPPAIYASVSNCKQIYQPIPEHLHFMKGFYFEIVCY